MNYFKVKSAGFIGNKLMVVDVECVQQKRLPYLQIIGGAVHSASAQRERVMAAIESSGFRLPSRRITVNICGGGAGTVLESTDLAVALAILGSSGLVRQDKLSTVLACGALSLEGKLLPLSSRAPLRAWLGRNRQTTLLLPWEDSLILGERSSGGGFLTLADVVAGLRQEPDFLRGPRLREIRAPEPPKEEKRWEELAARPLARRAALIAAAGGHSLLIAGGAESAGQSIARCVHALLPPMPEELLEEVSGVQQAFGEKNPEARPFRAVRNEHWGRLCRLDHKSGQWGELSLAHGGVLYLDGLGENPVTALKTFQEPLDTGQIRSLRGGKCQEYPADWILVGRSPLCPCGEVVVNSPGCVCLPSEIERFHFRMERMGGLFQLRYPVEEEGAPQGGLALATARDQVARARRLQAERQGVPNARLAPERIFELKEWSGEAFRIWSHAQKNFGRKCSTAMARLAVTISDLRADPCVGRSDALEARHHVSAFSPALEVGGMRRSRVSLPARNSTAIP